jgi:P27 family predicted phage terminase small subunit
MPASLGPVGITLWEELIAELSNRRTLVAGDRRILEATCLAYEHLMTASATIAEKGSVYESDTANGTMIRPRPECQLRSDAFRRYVKCLDALGLTPNSRMRLQILQVPDRSAEEQALDEFFPPDIYGRT